MAGTGDAPPIAVERGRVTPWYVGDRGVCAGLTLVASVLLALGSRARPARALRAAWIAVIVAGVANGLALNLQPANLINGNLSQYYLGAKYPVPYADTYRLVQAAADQPQIGIRDLDRPGQILRSSPGEQRAYYLDLLRAERVPFDPLLPLDSLARRARESGAITADSRRLLHERLPADRIADFRRDVRVAVSGAILQPLTIDFGYNGSPFYGLIRQSDPTIHAPYGPPAAWANALWQLLGVALFAWIAGSALGFTLDERLAAAALIVASWDFTGFAMPGLMFTELWVPIAIAAWAMRHRRAAVAGVAIAFAGLLKLFPFLLVLPAVVAFGRSFRSAARDAITPATRRWAVALVAAGAIATPLLGLSSALTGRSWADFLHKIVAEFEAAPNLVNSANPIAALMTLGVSYRSPFMRVVPLVATVLLVAMFLRSDDAKFHAALPRRTLVLMVAAGWLVKSWLNYYVVAPLLLLPLYARERRAAAAAMAAAMAAAYLLPEFDDPLILAHPWVHFLKLVPYLLLPAWMVAVELGGLRWSRVERRVGAGVAVVLALAAGAEVWRLNKVRWLADEASAAFRAGRAEEALEGYRELLRLSPGDASARRREAIALATLGRMDEALVSFGRSVALSPRDAAARDDYGRGLLMAGRLDEAATQLEAARALTPDDPQVLFMLARVRSSQGRRSEAVGLLSRARELEPGEPRIAEALQLAAGP
jgi:tetratricopeptide (TPR) repeat protein